MFVLVQIAVFLVGMYVLLEMLGEERKERGRPSKPEGEGVAGFFARKVAALKEVRERAPARVFVRLDESAAPAPGEADAEADAAALLAPPSARLVRGKRGGFVVAADSGEVLHYLKRRGDAVHVSCPAAGAEAVLRLPIFPHTAENAKEARKLGSVHNLWALTAKKVAAAEPNLHAMYAEAGLCPRERAEAADVTVAFAQGEESAGVGPAVAVCALARNARARLAAAYAALDDGAPARLSLLGIGELALAPANAPAGAAEEVAWWE